MFVLAYAFRAMQELTFPAAEGTAAGMVSSCSSVPKTGVRLLAMALWDVARFLYAICCASGWADLAICIRAGSCWHWVTLSVLWFSSTCLQMAAALTRDWAVLTVLLCAISLPRTATAATSDLTAREARMQCLQAMTLLWLPACGLCAPVCVLGC